MAFDAFIKIEGITVDCLDDQHRGWIEVSGYSYGARQDISSTASVDGSGDSRGLFGGAGGEGYGGEIC